MNIVFAASEAAPLAKTGGLADVIGALPRALAAEGHEVVVVLPYYRRDVARVGVVPEATGHVVEIWIDGVRRHVPLHRAVVNGVRFVLVEQDDLFDRDGLYGATGHEAYADNPLRFLLFGRVVLEAAAWLYPKVDIVHCHDWQTAMVPLLLRTQYRHLPALDGTRSVYTIHNLAYQGLCSPDWIARLGLPPEGFHPDGYEFHGQVNFMKAGILAADAITTVSPTYAQEILTPEYGCQLEGFLCVHRERLYGIVNGLDVESYDPATDAALARNYAPGRMAGKAECKRELQKQLDLDVVAEAPMLTLVSRLAEQKGIDLILPRLDAWLAAGCQCVMLGSGDPALEAALRAVADKHPRRMHFHCGFDEVLARRIYAAGDLFLMPSRFEPCGLGQLIAMRYGNLPLARRTGGLADTVVDYTRHRATGLGFTFDAATPEALEQAWQQAMDVFRRPRAWSRLRARAMRRDSSWDASARRYLALYEALR